MADPKAKARREVERTQASYEKNVNAAREARRKSFQRAQEAGLSLREIGGAAGLHHSRVAEIIRGE